MNSCSLVLEVTDHLMRHFLTCRHNQTLPLLARLSWMPNSMMGQVPNWFKSGNFFIGDLSWGTFFLVLAVNTSILLVKLGVSTFSSSGIVLFLATGRLSGRHCGLCRNAWQLELVMAIGKWHGFIHDMLCSLVLVWKALVYARNRPRVVPIFPQGVSLTVIEYYQNCLWSNHQLGSRLNITKIRILSFSGLAIARKMHSWKGE